ncbi:MAG: STAS domain-containing protein [Vulcanimicrobiaceae bacterium]
MATTLLQQPPNEDAIPQGVGPVAIIVLEGEYDLSRRQELASTLQAIPICDIAIIDMGQVTYMDSTALTCFVQLKKRMRRNTQGVVRVVGLRARLHRLYEFAHLHQLFEIYATIGDAMGEYGYTVTHPKRF